MIDTIVISVPIENVVIKDYDVFSPSARGLFEPPYYKLGSRAHFSCVLNPSKLSEYAPRLTLSKRMRAGGFSIALKIELSLPKLMFGNNFDELDDSDLFDLISRLCYKLAENGIIIKPDVLLNTDITGIHYGKNVILTGHATASSIIKILAKLNISKRLDAGHTDFRNDGQAVRFHTNHYELTFYDKMKDLEQAKISEFRAIENDNAVQLDLFSNTIRKSEIEVLRIECRLNNRRNIKVMLDKCKITVENLTFKDLYSKDISTKVLKYFWDNSVESSLNIVILSARSVENTYLQLRMKGLKEMDALKCCGALMFVKENGIRSLKQNLAKNGNTFYRINNTLKTIDFQDNYMYSCFQMIKQAIYENKRIKLDEYKGGIK